MATNDWINNLSGFISAIGATGADAAGIMAELATSMGEAAKAAMNLDDESQNLLIGLEKQVALNRELGTAYKTLIKNSLFLEQRNAQINKSFGVGVKQAAALSEKFQQVANVMGVSGTQVAKYGGSIKKMLPMLNQAGAANKDFYKGMQQTQHILQTNIGLTEDQANAYTQYAMQNGASADSMLKATQAMSEELDPGGTMGYFKMVTEEIAGTGNEIQLQYGKIPGNLEMAVLKAKKLGFTLEDLAGTADNLLEIESSIGQELEYQLLSGHRLVDNQGNSLTNLYREAALRGDMNKQADVLNDILESEGDVLENNLFARKQMAATLGMEERQLASALQKKKILDKASAAGIQIDLEGADAANAMKKAADAVQARALSSDDFEKLKEATDTRTTDDILDQILKVTEEQYMLDILTSKQQENIMNNQAAIKGGAANIGASFLNFSDDQLKTMGSALAASRTITAAGEIKGEVETAEITGIGTTGVDLKNDAVIPPGFGKRVLSFPEDTLQPSIAFNDKDHIMASTNSPLASSGGGADISQFAAMIVAAINNQTRALKSDATFSGGLNAPYYG